MLCLLAIQIEQTKIDSPFFCAWSKQEKNWTRIFPRKVHVPPICAQGTVPLLVFLGPPRVPSAHTNGNNQYQYTNHITTHTKPRIVCWLQEKQQQNRFSKQILFLRRHRRGNKTKTQEKSFLLISTARVLARTNTPSQVLRARAGSPCSLSLND